MNIVVRFGDSRATVAATALFLALAAAIVFQLFDSIGVASTLQLVAALVLAGALPGAALVRLLFARPSLLHYLILGTVFGLGLWSLGGMVSHITALDSARWLPAIAAFALWLVPRKGGAAQETPDRQDLPVLAIVGSGAAVIALLPVIRAILLSQPANWVGWHRFYVDLPFQIAITGEVAARAPQEHPWVADTVLSYPWLFHSAMGVWASITNIPSADIVLQAWPVLIALLLPPTIAITAWELTRNNVVALLAPIAYVLAHGIVFATGSLDHLPLLAVSPTRDFAHLFVLLTVLSLARALSSDSPRSLRSWWLLSLAVSTFVATGSKGSAMPILLGGALSAALVLVVARRMRFADLIALGVFALAAVSSYLLTLPDPATIGAVVWQPLSFLTAQTPDRPLVALAILGILAFATVGAWLVIGRSPSGGWLVASLLCGVIFAGLLGLALLTYPGNSQLYFWQSAQPVLAIVLVWASVILYGTFGRAYLVAMVAVFFLSTVLWVMKPQVVLVSVATALVAVGAAVYLRISSPNAKATGRKRIRLVEAVVVLATAGALTQSAQVLSLPANVGGGAASQADDSGAVHHSQLAAFRFIRANSSPTDKFITNKHCQTGSLVGGDCDARWFAASAWTERRALVEGWAYPQNVISKEWVTTQLGLSDGFISSPSTAEKRQLVSKGVAYVYVDKRDPYAGNLALFAPLVYESEWAKVYSLKR